MYYYLVNAQGDVVGLIDSTGAAVVQYTYDAWGRLLSSSGTAASTLGINNPLRYRSYIYDHETGLYYLQSRYYNPTWGRFINADGAITTGQGLLGNNMFVYCLNNPAKNLDKTGKITEVIRWIVSGERILSAFKELFSIAKPALGYAALFLCYSKVETPGLIAKYASVAETISEESEIGEYSVYFLSAIGDSSNKIVYVGRVKTANLKARMSYHKSKGRKLVNIMIGLDYQKCRAIEQAGMIHFHTINRQNPLNNQIRGISPFNPKGSAYYNAGVSFSQSGIYPQNSILPASYWENLTEEEFLNGGL